MQSVQSRAMCHCWRPWCLQIPSRVGRRRPLHSRSGCTDVDLGDREARLSQHAPRERNGALQVCDVLWLRSAAARSRMCIGCVMPINSSGKHAIPYAHEQVEKHAMPMNGFVGTVEQWPCMFMCVGCEYPGVCGCLHLCDCADVHVACPTLLVSTVGLCTSEQLHMHVVEDTHPCTSWHAQAPPIMMQAPQGLESGLAMCGGVTQTLEKQFCDWTPMEASHNLNWRC